MVDANDKFLSQLEFLMICKVKDFKDEGYEDVSVQIVKSYLLERKWKKMPKHIHEMTRDVLQISYSDIMDYLKLRDVYYAEDEIVPELFSNLI